MILILEIDIILSDIHVSKYGDKFLSNCIYLAMEIAYTLDHHQITKRHLVKWWENVITLGKSE